MFLIQLFFNKIVVPIQFIFTSDRDITKVDLGKDERLALLVHTAMGVLLPLPRALTCSRP